MQKTIKTAHDLGWAIKAVRKHHGVRIDDLAGMCGVSKQTTQNLEAGFETVQIGTLLKHLNELGIELSIDVLDSVQELHDEIQSKGKTLIALSSPRSSGSPIEGEVQDGPGSISPAREREVAEHIHVLLDYLHTEMQKSDRKYPVPKYVGAGFKALAKVTQYQPIADATIKTDTKEIQ